MSSRFNTALVLGVIGIMVAVTLSGAFIVTTSNDNSVQTDELSQIGPRPFRPTGETVEGLNLIPVTAVAETSQTNAMPAPERLAIGNTVLVKWGDALYVSESVLEIWGGYPGTTYVLRQQMVFDNEIKYNEKIYVSEKDMYLDPRGSPEVIWFSTPQECNAYLTEHNLPTILNV